MTAQAWDRLFDTYGVPVPAEPIRLLVAGYLDNGRKPVAGDTTTFDSTYPDGTPGKFTLCSDQFGHIKLFAAPGIEWAPVPTLD